MPHKKLFDVNILRYRTFYDRMPQMDRTTVKVYPDNAWITLISHHT